MAGPVSEARIGVRSAALAVDAATSMGWATAFGICAISYYMLRGFFSFEQDTVGRVLGWIGGPGKWLQSKIEGAEHRVTHWVGQAAASSEARMGDAFHAGANQIQSIGHEIYGLSIAYWHLAQGTASLFKSIASGEAWQEIFHNTIYSEKVGNRANTRDLNKLRKGLWGVGAALGGLNLGAWLKGLGWFGHHTQAQIQALQGGYAHPGVYPRPGEGATARDIADQGTRAAEATWKYLLSHPWAVPTTAFAGAVAVAIGRLGGGWIRCGNWNRLGRGVCRAPRHLIDDLLSLLTDFAVLVNICKILPWLETGVSAVAVPMIEALTVAEAGLCSGPGDRAPDLVVPQLYRPPVAGVTTLHLP